MRTLVALLLLSTLARPAGAAPPKAETLYFLAKTLASTVADLALATGAAKPVEVKKALKRTVSRAHTVRNLVRKLGAPDDVTAVQLASAGRMEEIGKTFEKEDAKSIVEGFGLSPALAAWIKKSHPDLEIYANLGSVMGSFEGIGHWVRAGVKKPFYVDLSPTLAEPARGQIPAPLQPAIRKLAKLEGKRYEGDVAREVAQDIQLLESALKK